MSKPRMFIEASATGTTGTIRLVDRISEYTQSSSATIKSIVDEYLKTGVTTAELYVNSAGGNCFEATEMCNDLDRLSAVKLKIGAVSASAATYFMTRFPSAAYPNSQIMIHRPKLGTYGDVVTIKADLKLLENVTDDYKMAYATKMNKTVEEIEELFAQGDYWMTANEAKALGLLDTILEQTEEVTSESITILEAVAAPIIPDITKENQKQMERKQLISWLKLSANATDVEIEAALTELVTKALRTEKLEVHAKKTLEDNVKALCDKAVLDKKFTADLVPHYAKLAHADFEGTKIIIDAMQGVQKFSAEIDAPGPTANGRDKWTLEDFQNNDPEALMEMMVKEPAKFQKLEAAYFS